VKHPVDGLAVAGVVRVEKGVGNLHGDHRSQHRIGSGEKATTVAVVPAAWILSWPVAAGVQWLVL
jgi:hypothetical protein